MSLRLTLCAILLCVAVASADKVLPNDGGGASKASDGPGPALRLIPSSVPQPARLFLSGAASIALAGAGLGDGKEPRGAVDELFFAAGGIAAELLLLRLLMRPPRAGPFADAPRGLSQYAIHILWLLLVAAIAVPNGVVEAGLVAALLARLPLETYLPALVVGRAARPHVVAFLRTWPVTAGLYKSVTGKHWLYEKGLVPHAHMAMWALGAIALGLIITQVIYEKVAAKKDEGDALDIEEEMDADE